MAAPVRFSRLAAALALLLAASCRICSPDRFHAEVEIGSALPPLRVEVYSHTLLKPVLERELKEALSRAAGGATTAPRGKAVLRGGIGDHTVGWYYILPTIMTLTAINLFGFPWASQSATADLTLQIEDNAGQKVAEYRTSRRTTVFSAYYWGYSALGAAIRNLDHPLARATWYEASVRALDDLLEQLDRDAPVWKAKL